MVERDLTLVRVRRSALASFSSGPRFLTIAFSCCLLARVALPGSSRLRFRSVLPLTALFPRAFLPSSS